MKDEFKGKLTIDFFGLKSKMYSLIAVDVGEVKKAKWVYKNIFKSITHKGFVDPLFNRK